MKKLILFFILTVSIGTLKAQEIPANIATALKNDDAATLTTLLTKDNINNCYGVYSLISQSIRDNAQKCFDLLIQKGADVNKTCNGYVPPLMHAAKYGRLEMVQTLIAKGAKADYKYDGDFKGENGPQKGETAITYAEKYQHDDVVEYLQSLKLKQ